MVHKILPSPTAGADPNRWYGTDQNKLINHLQGVSSSDPFTLHVDVHTFKHSTTNAAGDILKGDGTRFIRFARGTANQVLKVNSGGTDLEWGTIAGTTDEKSIVREAGVQVGSAARKLNFAVATDFDITEDVGNDEIDIDIADNAITNTHLAGSIANSKLLQITDKAKLHSSILYSDVDNSLGAHYLDVGEIGAPASPAANTGRFFFDSADGHFKGKKSTGVVVDFESIGTGWDPALAETLTNKKIGNYLDFDRNTLPSNPSADDARMGFVQTDANNDSLFIIQKVAGTFTPVYAY